MKIEHIGFIGLGLIGGSIAKKIKQNLPSCNIIATAHKDSTIEDAYQMLGIEIPQNYKETFLETFYESLDNKTNFELCFRKENPMEQISHFNNGEKNFNGMESFLIDLRKKAIEVYKNKHLNTQNKTNNTNDER